jgi:magnesium transporter
MLHIVRWDPIAQRMDSISASDLPESRADLPPDSMIWIDLEDPTPEEEERVFKRFFPVHPLTIDDTTKLRRDPEQGPHLPKVEEFPNYLFVIVNPLPAENCDAATSTTTTLPGAKKRPFRFSRVKRPQLSAILDHTVLVTHHYTPMPCIRDGLAKLSRHSDYLRRGPDYMFHLILDGIVDEYAPVVERFAGQLDRLESQMFRRPVPEILAKLLKIKRQVSYLRKTLILEREVLARLIRGEFDLVDAREIVYYRNVYDHLVRYTELVESAREMVSDLMQTHLSAVSTRLNEVMKVLTMISTVVLPMTLIAGIYGMNFENLPEKEWRFGYPFALGLMLIMGMISFTLFRWKKWI